MAGGVPVFFSNRDDGRSENRGLRRSSPITIPLPVRLLFIAALALLCVLLSASRLAAQESPYIVTYDHYLEEPGSLDVEYFSTFGTQRNANDFQAFWAEFEYGVAAWYTTEFYLDGQTTFTTAPCSRASAGRTAFAFCRASISSILSSTSNSRTRAARTKS